MLQRVNFYFLVISKQRVKKLVFSCNDTDKLENQSEYFPPIYFKGSGLPIPSNGFSITAVTKSKYVQVYVHISYQMRTHFKPYVL